MPDLNRGAVQVLHRVLGGSGFAPDLSGGDAPEWMAAAVCASTDPEAFFPEKGGSVREAKRICNGNADHPPCPVKTECLAYALEHVERFGVWGGLTERERRRLLPAPEDRPTRTHDDTGICPVCNHQFRSVRKHRARNAVCRETVAA